MQNILNPKAKQVRGRIQKYKRIFTYTLSKEDKEIKKTDWRDGMTPDRLQQYMSRQYIQMQLWDLEEKKRIVKGNKTKIGEEIAKLKKKIKEIDQDLKGIK